MRSRRIRKIYAALLAVVLTFAAASAVSAAEAGDIDWSRTGSITLNVADGSSGEAIAGAEIAIIRAATASAENGALVYTPTEAFSGFSFDDISDTELPGKLAAHALSSGAKLQTKLSAADGTVAFSDLPLGLYLVMQTNTKESGSTFSPFLIMLPESGDAGWVYDVTGKPKAQSGVTVTPVPTTHSKTTTTTKTTTGTKLPQTGQLNWPIPVLAAAGMASIVFGFSLVFMKRDRA